MSINLSTTVKYSTIIIMMHFRTGRVQENEGDFMVLHYTNNMWVQSLPSQYYFFTTLALTIVIEDERLSKRWRFNDMKFNIFSSEIKYFSIAQSLLCGGIHVWFLFDSEWKSWNIRELCNWIYERRWRKMTLLAQSNLNFLFLHSWVVDYYFK